MGLGDGPVEDLTLRAWELLASAKPLKLRNPGHEVAQTLGARGMAFEEVAAGNPESLATEIVEWASGHDVSVYAHPGHPLEAPETLPILRTAEERGVGVEVIPALWGADRLPASDPITRAHVAPAAANAAVAFGRLVQVMARLRGPHGCPWDREQTHASLAPHLIEEAYEALDAIDRSDLEDLEEELGDLLLQIVFHSELARESERFDVTGVIQGLLAKLFYRHPHVFGDVVVSGPKQVLENWEALKRAERERDSPFDGLPPNLPALLYAYKVQRRASSAGREGSEPAPALLEELERLAGDLGIEEAVGELLLRVVSMAAAAGVDPEEALRRRVRRSVRSMTR